MSVKLCINIQMLQWLCITMHLCTVTIARLLTIFIISSLSYVWLSSQLSLSHFMSQLSHLFSSAKLQSSTVIGKVRLYSADGAIIKAFTNTKIVIIIGAANVNIPTLAFDPSAATQWVNSNMLPYYPTRNIALITVENEVVTLMDQGLIS